MHIIRLRGPWEIVVRESGATHRVQWPLTISSVPMPLAAGRLMLQRTFHRPTGLELHQVVALKVNAKLPVLAISLNASSVRLNANHRAEITELLRQHNALNVQLQIEDVDTTEPAESILDVQLEITP